jgi:hypothetical protein
MHQQFAKARAFHHLRPKQQQHHTPRNKMGKKSGAPFVRISEFTGNECYDALIFDKAMLENEREKISQSCGAR